MATNVKQAIIRIYDEAGHRLTAIMRIGSVSPEVLAPLLTKGTEGVKITNGEHGDAKFNGMGDFAACLVITLSKTERNYIIGPKAKGIGEAYEYQFRFKAIGEAPELRVYTIEGEGDERRMIAWPPKPKAEPKADEPKADTPKHTMASGAEFAASLGTEIDKAASTAAGVAVSASTLYKQAGKVLNKSKATAKA